MTGRDGGHGRPVSEGADAAAQAEDGTAPDTDRVPVEVLACDGRFAAIATQPAADPAPGSARTPGRAAPYDGRSAGPSSPDGRPPGRATPDGEKPAPADPPAGPAATPATARSPVRPFRPPPHDRHSTPSDASGVPGAAALGRPAEGSVRAVIDAIRCGKPVTLRVTGHWPLPDFPRNVSEPVLTQAAEASAHRAQSTATAAQPDAQRDSGDGATAPGETEVQPGRLPAAGRRDDPALSPEEPRFELWVTDEAVPLGPDAAVLRPPSLTVGIGAGVGVDSGEVITLVEQALAEAGLSLASVAELATVDAKAGEPGLLSAADRLRLPLRTYPAHVLAAVEVPNPSQAAYAALGTPSVAEAAALAAAGEGARLVVPKAKSQPSGGGPAMATAAVARRAPHARLTRAPAERRPGSAEPGGSAAASRTAPPPAAGPPRQTGTASKENQ